MGKKILNLLASFIYAYSKMYIDCTPITKYMFFSCKNVCIYLQGPLYIYIYDPIAIELTILSFLHN